MDTKHIIRYEGELTRTRFWQDAALAVLRAVVTAKPPTNDQIERSPAAIEQYARDVARASFTIADEMYRQHGPSVSSRLQGEDPFKFDPGDEERFTGEVEE